LKIDKLYSIVFIFLWSGGRILYNDSIKRYVGNTPLIRAENIEKQLGISKIYLKLEGNNPSGYLEDRLAFLIIRDALEKGKNTICAGKSERIMVSLGFLSEFFNIKCVFYVPNKNKIAGKIDEGSKVKIVEFGNSRQDCISQSNKVSYENDWYNANILNESNALYNYTYAQLAKEIDTQLGGQIDTVFCQTGRGASIVGLHWGFKQLWIDEEIKRVPKLYACSSGLSNPIVKAYKENQDTMELFKTNSNTKLIEQISHTGQEAVNALNDTRGGVIEVYNDEVLSSKLELQKLEKIRLSISNALPIAAFYKFVSEGRIKEGNHVIILKDGRTSLDISEISLGNLPVSYDKLVALLHEWLIEYRDPRTGIKEGLDEAFKSGYVLCAYQKGVLVGICVVVNTGFEVFLPKYHLGYIATKNDIKGRGIGTQLLKKAAELAKGQLSLHVDISNNNATKLYEKMGFKKKYYRMIYDGIHK